MVVVAFVGGKGTMILADTAAIVKIGAVGSRQILIFELVNCSNLFFYLV